MTETVETAVVEEPWVEHRPPENRLLLRVLVVVCGLMLLLGVLIGWSFVRTSNIASSNCETGSESRTAIRDLAIIAIGPLPTKGIPEDLAALRRAANPQRVKNLAAFNTQYPPITC